MFFNTLKQAKVVISAPLFTKICKPRSFATSEKYTISNAEHGIANITMCHKQTRNALSLSMMEDLIKNISEYENDPKVRAIILSAEGPIFSSGHNLKELSSDKNLQKQVFTCSSNLMYKIIDCPVPIIARVDGLAAAAGCQLVAQCDMVFCTPKSAFSTPGAKFGLFCSTPGVALARCVPKSTAMKMLLTGIPITAQEAETRGLVTKVSTNLDEDIKTTCDAIMALSRSVVELGKKFYYKQVNVDIRKAYEMGGEIMVQNLQLEDGREGIKSFIEKRKPIWKN